MAASSSSDMKNNRLVCVTGASGYIGSWLVMRLLEKGYAVNGTVRNSDDDSKVAHLVSLPGAKERLQLFKADLNGDDNAFDAAVEGCEGVFHAATPVNLDGNALQGDIVGPAVRGTLNVLRACVRSGTVKRVIHTSSVAAVRYHGKPVPDDIVNETHWTSVDFCRKAKMIGWMYYIAKTYAEDGALKFATDHDIEVITVLPSVTAGDFLTPEIPGSVSTLMALAKGDYKFCSYLPRIPYVHIEDVVRAHIFVYENEVAKGRYICSLPDITLQDLSQLFRDRHHVDVPISFDGLHEDYVFPRVDSTKLKSEGFSFEYSMEHVVDDAFNAYRKRGFL